ncbi:MAG: undecaprenyl/decaprenyl-phosphate alpha-N-acetylglucosaminyl 1-phosphate transferase [Actinomycetota bacterium]|nr:undecaprenyl/decaprenyl-phosphate alpha-N-acetylglucosaminyl 1-phosphate transferase [Actinomycetota bacterium]
MLLATVPVVHPVDGAQWVRIVAAGLLSFVVVLAVVPVVRRIAVAKGITDRPRQDRWHKSPTPYLGGAALLLGALGSSAFLPQWNVEALTLVAGALVLAVVGLVDDFRNVSAVGRLLIEAGVASAAFFAGARVHMFNEGVDLVLTVGWFVVVTNAFNLLDNMDGGMASIAAVVSAAIATVALVEGQVLVGGLAVVTGAACVAFLFYNWYPAQIFMGDAGSLFLGFMLAATSLKLRPRVPHVTSVTGLVLLLSPALFDTSLVVISRVRAGRSVFIGGTDHTSHRLMRLGLGQRATAAILAGASMTLVTAGVLVSERRVDPAVAGVGVAVLWIVAAARLLRIPVYEAPKSTAVTLAG